MGSSGLLLREVYQEVFSRLILTTVGTLDMNGLSGARDNNPAHREIYQEVYLS